MTNTNPKDETMKEIKDKIKAIHQQIKSTPFDISLHMELAKLEQALADLEELRGAV